MKEIASAQALALAAALALPGVAVFAQDSLRTEDERNTVAVFRDASHGVVHVEARAAAETKFEKKVIEAATGSGFLVDRDGRVLTNAHVIDGKNEIEVVLGSGRRLSARLVGTAPQLDLALLHADVPADELHPLELGDSRALQVGQKVLAIGNPFGLHDTLTVGVVSALNRTVGGTAVELQDALIQIDAAINPGNSGGPLLDSSGKVVGVNAIGSGGQNVGFAIPIHLALRVMRDLVDMGHPYHPRLGFSGVEVTPALARLFGLSAQHGYLIQEVLPRSAAALAGLRAGDRVVVSGDVAYVLGGDIVTAANDRPIAGSGDLARLLLDLGPGELLRLEVDRGGRRQQIAIRLEAMRMQF